MQKLVSANSNGRRAEISLAAMFPSSVLPEIEGFVVGRIRAAQYLCGILQIINDSINYLTHVNVPYAPHVD